MQETCRMQLGKRHLLPTVTTGPVPLVDAATSWIAGTGPGNDEGHYVYSPVPVCAA